MDLDLKEVKKRIKIEFPDPEVSKTILSWILEPKDCFGRRYLATDQFCINCVILADVDGRKEPIWVFCRELCEKSETESPSEPVSEDLQKATEEIQQKKAEKELKTTTQKFDAEWKAELATLLFQKVEDNEIVKSISTKYNLEERKVKMVLSGFKSAAKRGYTINPK